MDRLNNLYKYLKCDDECKGALKQLQVLLQRYSLDSYEMKNWIKHNEHLYEKELLSFDVAYLNHEQTTEDKIFVRESNTFIDSADFKSIIAFCKIQSLLLGNGYQLTVQEEQEMLKDYYYQPNRNDVEDKATIERSLSVLNI